jgi:hypothetical protein
MMFQEAPPDTSAYMIAGYAVFFIVSAIYLLSLVVRQRNLSMDLETLEAMRAESPKSGRRNAMSRPTGPPSAQTRPRGRRKTPARKKGTRRK